MKQLALIGVVLLLVATAGCCSASSAPASSAKQTSSPNDRAADPLELTVVNHDWKRTGESTWKAVYVVGAARNTGTATIGTGFVEVKWFDKDGNVLGTSSESVDDLDPGQTLRFEIMYIGTTDESEVDHYTIGPGTLYET